MSAGQAFVTLATTDAYSMGAVVVARSLRRHGTTRALVVMVSPDVSREARNALERAFDTVLPVDVLDSGDPAHLTWLGRPDLGVTFTKLHCWSLTQYSKCVFLDADTLVLANVDDLFDREELSAAPDPGWPDCFNSGVFVFEPSLDTHHRLLEHVRQCGSFDGGDQGLLNTFFSDWPVSDISRHLPFVYNLSANAVYTYLPAFKRYGRDAKIVHFLGAEKPWHLRSDTQLDAASPLLGQFVAMWWKEYRSQSAHDLPKSVHLSQSGHLQPKSVRLSQLAHFLPKSAPSPIHLPERTNIPPAIQRSEAAVPPEQNWDIANTVGLRSASTERLRSPVTEREMRTQEEERWTVRKDSDWTDTQDPPDSDEGSEVTEAASETNQKDSPTYPTETEEEKMAHRRKWEEGQVDYLGKDAFNNIQKKLDRFLD